MSKSNDRIEYEEKIGKSKCTSRPIESFPNTKLFAIVKYQLVDIVSCHNRVLSVCE